MTTFLQARTPRTLGATRGQALAAMAAAGAPVAGWSSRAPQRILVDDTSTRTVEESEIRADLAAMIDLSELARLDPDWCAAWMTWFAEVYIPALPAVWNVPVLTTAPPQTIATSDTVVLQATGGAIFELSITAPALLSSTGTLRMRARAAGVGGNVSPGTITKILSAPAGLQLTGTPTLYTAGRDLETPTAAITRCLGKWAALGAGWTAASFDYLIQLFAPTITRWLVRVDNPAGPGTIAVILANAAGPATGPEVAAVLAGLTARARFCLGCGGLTCAAAVAHAITSDVILKGNGSNPTLDTDAAAALQALIDAFPIGPAYLVAELSNGVLMGGAFLGPIAIPTDMSGSMSTTILAPGLVGYTGVEGLVTAALTGTLGAGEVFVFSPAPVVEVQ